ncbi:MAG: hypothetical protein ACERKN_11350 [Velocimicrobium sp.]
MKTKMKFGDCLNLLLSTFDIRMNYLAKAINVDSSLVSRWIHNKRIPPLNTSYIENISNFLARNALNSFQLKLVDDIFQKTCEDAKNNLSDQEKIKILLLESQGYSFEYEYEKKKKLICCMESEEKSPIKATSLFSNLIPLSGNDKIIPMEKDVYTVGLHLLKLAIAQTNVKDQTLYISFNNDVPNMFSDDLIQWRNLLLEAIQTGWTIIVLLRFNRNTVRNIHFINFAAPLILTNKFIMYYFKNYDAFSSGIETLIIPDVGALICFVTESISHVDSALYLKDRCAINMLRSYTTVLINSYSTPLIKYYSSKNIREYSNCLLKIEEGIGSRHFNKYGIGMLLLPPHLYYNLLEKCSISHEGKKEAYDYYIQRLHAFFKNVKHYDYKDIFFLEALRDLVEHQQFYFYHLLGIEKIEVTIPEIIELLNNIIVLLKNNDNYSLALIQNEKQNNLISGEFDCFVKEGKGIILEGYNTIQPNSKIMLSIQEPMIIQALEAYYNHIWEQIAPVNKEKTDIIHFLENQIYLLEKRNL